MNEALLDGEADVAIGGEPHWNWAAGVVPATVAYVGWYLLARYVLYRDDPDDSETILELMFAVMALVVLLVAFVYLRLARSTAFVAALTIAGGALISCALGDRLLEELDTQRRQSEAFASFLGGDVGSGGGFTKRLVEYGLVGLIACGPFVASLLALGLRRRVPKAGSWNWAAGAVAALAVLLGWETGLQLARAVAGQGEEMFAKADYSGVVLLTVLLVIATGLTLVASWLMRTRPIRPVIIGCLLVAGLFATVGPTWRTFHRWSGMQDEARAEHDQVVAEVRARIADGRMDAANAPSFINEPYEEYVRPTEQKVFAVLQDLAPITIALMAFGLRRRAGSSVEAASSGREEPFDPDAFAPPAGDPVHLPPPYVPVV